LNKNIFRQIDENFIDLAENRIVLNNKTLWKNHRNYDFFPEFCQKWLFLRHKRQELWKEK